MKKVVLFLVGVVVLGSQVSENCSEDQDCNSLSYCEEGECKHKDLFPLKTIEIIGTVLILVLSALANSAGIGGGPLMVPILILLLGFNTHLAIPLAQTIIFGGSLIAIILKLKMRHPQKNKPLIYYEIIMHVQSPVLLGTSFGVILNRAFPSWLILVLLSALLIYTGYKTLKKGLKLFKSESQCKAEAWEGICDEPFSETSEHSRDYFASQPERNPTKESLQKIHKKESGLVEWRWLAVILGIFGIVVLGSFMKGDKGAESIIGIENCSANYWVFLIVFSLVLVGIDLATGWLLIRENKKKETLGYEFDSGDLHWDLRKVSIVGGIGLFAGLGAGMLGIGGGLVMNPVMLSLGVRPEVAAASSSFMILFTSSVAVIQFGTAGLLKLGYAIWLLVTAFLGSALGIFSLQRIMQRHQRSSVLVVLLAFMLFLAAVVIVVYGVIDLIQQESEGSVDYGFSDFCK